MYLSESALADAASIRWDVIIVGAGAVGLVLAASMSRAGRRVLLLETGSTDPGAAQDLNAVEVTGRPHLGALYGRARVVGGTTTLWGGQLTRFVPYDFEARDIIPDCRWPLAFADLERYYVETASLLGLDSAHLEDESLRARSVDGGAERTSGCEIFYTRWLREPNLARWFAQDLRDGSMLTLAPSCHATEILCGGPESRISGVRVRFGAGKSVDLQGKDLVLACGTIEISRLLLLTAKKNPGLSWCRNPNIGAYFQDHLDLVIGKVRVRDQSRFADCFENRVIRGYKYQPKLRLLDAVMRREGLLNIACSMRFDSRVTEDLQALKQFVKALRSGTRVARPLETLKRIAALNRVWFPLIWRYLRHRRILAIADRGVSVIAHCEQRPIRASRIGLSSSSVDRFADPIAELHWRIDEPLQLKTLRSFAAHLGEFLRTAGAELEADAGVLREDAAILAQASDSYHQCGGARMAARAEEGVVDSNCRVFGTENLFVAGAAVFPCASFANPTFTAMALARRLGEYLLGEPQFTRA